MRELHFRDTNFARIKPKGSKKADVNAGMQLEATKKMIGILMENM